MTPHESNHKTIMAPVLTTEQQKSAVDEFKEMIENEKEIIEKVPFDSGFGFGSSAEDFSQEENFEIELSKFLQVQQKP